MNPLLQLIQFLLDARGRRSPYDMLFGQHAPTPEPYGVLFGQPRLPEWLQPNNDIGAALEGILGITGRRFHPLDQPPQINVAQPQFRPETQAPIIRTAGPTFAPAQDAPNINTLQQPTIPMRGNQNLYNLLPRR